MADDADPPVPPVPPAQAPAAPLAPPPSPHPPPSLGAQFAAAMARPSGWIGIAGILLLLFAISYTGYVARKGNAGEPCEVGAEDWKKSATLRDAETFRIVKVDPVAFQFRRRVCVVVENAIAPSRLNKLRQDVKLAEAAYAAATPELRAEARTDLVSAQAVLNETTKGYVYRLYVDGRPSELTAHVRPVSEAQPLSFTVEPEEDAESANAMFWRKILAAPTRNGLIAMEIGLAPQDELAPAASARNIVKANGRVLPIVFVLYRPIVMWTALAGIVCLLIGFAGLAYRTPLLRDGRTALTSYSLSRVQMAFWLVLTTTGFLYVWVVTGQYVNVFPPALFVLIGIAGATAGAAQALGGPSDDAPLSRNFISDIAGAWKDGQIQLHRLQIIAWTIILGMIFCWNIVAKLKLTSFDANLLLLAGVANGVYVTLKTRENN